MTKNRFLHYKPKYSVIRAIKYNDYNKNFVLCWLAMRNVNFMVVVNDAIFMQFKDHQAFLNKGEYLVETTSTIEIVSSYIFETFFISKGDR